MTTVLLLVHLFVTIALIGVVLIQRSEGGGLGIGTSQGMGSFMTGRGTANLLTRTTSILGAMFFGLSLALALMNRGTGGQPLDPRRAGLHGAGRPCRFLAGYPWRRTDRNAASRRPREAGGARRADELIQPAGHMRPAYTRRKIARMLSCFPQTRSRLYTELP